MLKNFIWNFISQHFIVAAYVGLHGHLVSVKKCYSLLYKYNVLWTCPVVN